MSNKDPDINRAYMREYMKRRYHARMAEFRRRLGGVCVECGGIEGLEFDHIDRTSKVDVIAKLWNKPMPVVEAELKKCQLLCAKCHLEKSQEVGDRPPAATHGTDAMYTHQGCRCGACRGAHAAVWREWSQRRRAGSSVGSST